MSTVCTIVKNEVDRLICVQVQTTENNESNHAIYDQVGHTENNRAEYILYVSDDTTKKTDLTTLSVTKQKSHVKKDPFLSSSL